MSKDQSDLQDLKEFKVNRDLSAPQGPVGPKGDPGTPENIVHVVCSDGSPGPGGEIMYKRDGAGFDPTTINLSNSPAGNSVLPTIAVIGSNVYAVWVDGVGAGENNEILFRMSTDGGATFDSTINLSNNVGFSWLPQIAASGDNVYVVWEDDTTGNNEILYRKSTDGGATFEDTIILSNNAGNSGQSAIAAAGNNVYVIWSDGTGGQADIHYRVSTDGGTTFIGIMNISNNPGFSRIPEIAASGDIVYVVWEDGNDILYRRSTDGGVTFSDAENLYRSSDNRGVTFSDTENLSNSPGSSEQPGIAVLGNNVYAVWKELIVHNGVGNTEILYKSSSDGGIVFKPTSTNLSNDGPQGFSISPAIAVS